MMTRVQIMQNYLSIFFTIVIIFAQSQLLYANDKSLVAPSCLAKPVEDVNVKGRASVVRFPNGREITVIGHIHGNRQIYDLHDLIVSRKLYQMSDQEFETLLINILRDNKKPVEGISKEAIKLQIINIKKTFGVDVSHIYDIQNGFDFEKNSVLDHAKQDLAFLKNRLKSRADRPNSVEFIGYEGTDRTAKENYVELLKVIEILNKEFLNRKENLSLTQEQFNDIILSSANGNVYLYLKNRSLFNQVPLFGTESESIIKKYGDESAIDVLSKAYKNLEESDDAFFESIHLLEQERLKQSPRLKEYFIKFGILYSEVIAMNITSTQELEKRLKDLGESPSWLSTSFQDVVSAMKRRISINNERDRASAENLAYRYQNGIHFAGLNHFRNTLSYLEKICSKELKYQTESSLPINASSTVILTTDETAEILKNGGQ